MTENELAKIVFDAGMKVHRALGPGLSTDSADVRK